MELSNLVAQPELIKITLDDEDTIKEYNEAVEFYTWDRAPLDVFLKLSNSLGHDHEASVATLKTLILTAEGKPVMTGNQILPAAVMVRAMAKIVELLGK